MQKSLQSLLDLQAVDSRLNQVRARLASYPQKLAAAEARASAARTELDQSKAAQVGAVRDRKKFELDVEQWKDRVRKYRDQTAQVKTNEAYKALQHEVELAEAEIAKAEDRLLVEMVNAEDYDRRVKVSEKRLKEIEQAVGAERAAVASEQTAAEKDFAAFTADRARVVADIPENLLMHYERIAKKHGGVGIAPVRGEKCGACGMRILPHVYQDMQRGSETLFQCESCTRLLYYIDEEAPAAPPPASQASA